MSKLNVEIEGLAFFDNGSGEEAATRTELLEARRHAETTGRRKARIGQSWLTPDELTVVLAALDVAEDAPGPHCRRCYAPAESALCDRCTDLHVDRIRAAAERDLARQAVAS